MTGLRPMMQMARLHVTVMASPVAWRYFARFVDAGGVLHSLVASTQCGGSYGSELVLSKELPTAQSLPGYLSVMTMPPEGDRCLVRLPREPFGEANRWYWVPLDALQWSQEAISLCPALDAPPK